MFCELVVLLPFVLCIYRFLRSCHVYPCLQCLHVFLQSLQLVFDLCCLFLCHVCLFACLCPCSILGLRPILYFVWALGLSLLYVRPQAHPYFNFGPQAHFVCLHALLCLCASYVVVFILFVITCLFGVLCDSCVFVCSFSYVSHVWLCFVFLHVCMNLLCLFLQILCGCVFV